MVESFEDQYPSVNVAYERAMASYQSMTERLESATQRIDSLLQLTITLTLAVPIAIGSLIEEPEFESPYALAAAVAFVLFLVTGFVARSLLGGLMLIDPAVLYNESLHLPEAEFKARSIYWAGEHFGHNSQTVWRKAWASYAMMAFFLAEIAMIIAWVALDANPADVPT